MAQLSAWQDYASHKLYIQQILVPLTSRNNIWVLPGKTGVVSLTLQPNKTSFTPRHTITRKGVTYVKPFDSKLPLRPIEIEFENNRCCIVLPVNHHYVCNIGGIGNYYGLNNCLSLDCRV